MFLDLSVLIRTRNEADRIQTTLNSIRKLGAEVVVIDAESTDKTKEISEGFGARVITNPWPGFGPQRYFGESQCNRRYIFSLDADEVVTPDLVDEIRNILTSTNPPRLLTVKKAIVFPHRLRPLPFGFCHEQILIYDKTIARTGPNPNWDQLDIKTDEKPYTLKAPLHHFTFRNWFHAIAKINYVAKLAAETQEQKSLAELQMRLIIELPYTFLKFYFIRRYFMGGFDGLIMAMITAVGRWLRIVMMYETTILRRRGI